MKIDRDSHNSQTDTLPEVDCFSDTNSVSGREEDIRSYHKRAKSVDSSKVGPSLSQFYSKEDISVPDFKLGFGKKKLSIFRGLPEQTWNYSTFLASAQKDSKVFDLYKDSYHFDSLKERGALWLNSPATRNALVAANVQDTRYY